MKLKCRTHKRRVIVLPGGKVVHREDGSVCRTERLRLGERVLTPKQALEDKEVQT